MTLTCTELWIKFVFETMAHVTLIQLDSPVVLRILWFSVCSLSHKAISGHIDRFNCSSAAVIFTVIIVFVVSVINTLHHIL